MREKIGSFKYSKYQVQIDAANYQNVEDKPPLALDNQAVYVGQWFDGLRQGKGM